MVEWWSGEKGREEWLKKKIRNDDVEDREEEEEEHGGQTNTGGYEDLEQLGYLHVVHRKEEHQALVFIIGKYVRPEVHDRERVLRHAMRKLVRLSEEDEQTMMKVVYINTQASPFENSPGFIWMLYTLSCVPKSLLERVECVYVLHPTLSSVAFWSGLMPMANALVLAAPVNVETVLRVEFLPKHARDIIAASSGEGGIFQFVVEEEAAMIDAMNYMPSPINLATS